MPNRIIKDSIHTSEKVNAMSDFQFRLWVSLIAYVDDYGRGDARPAVIRGTCFPLRERLTNKDIEIALAGLAGIGCVGLYTVDGRPYLCFPNWEKHQTVRNKRSKYPAPPDDLNAIDFNCNQMQANVPVIQSESESKSESNPKGVSRFAPPTREEAEAYFAEIHGTFNLEAWFSYYEQNGWMVGNRKMKDWKASMRYWQSKEKPAGPKTSQSFGAATHEMTQKKLDELRAVARNLGVKTE